jgi:hypothetical protein
MMKTLAMLILVTAVLVGVANLAAAAAVALSPWAGVGVVAAFAGLSVAWA